MFETFVRRNFWRRKARKIIKAVDWETWVRVPGLAPVQLDFTTKALNASSELADEYIRLGGASSPSNYADYFDYYSGLRVVFLERLRTRQAEVTLEILERIDADFNVTGTFDPECKQRWFPFGLVKGYEPVKVPSHKMVSTVGR